MWMLRRALPRFLRLCLTCGSCRGGLCLMSRRRRLALGASRIRVRLGLGGARADASLDGALGSGVARRGRLARQGHRRRVGVDLRHECGRHLVVRRVRGCGPHEREQSDQLSKTAHRDAS
jgi:hypothetical protein